MRGLFIVLMLMVFAEAKTLTLQEMKQENRVAFIIENTDYDGVSANDEIDEIDGLEEFLIANDFTIVYEKNSNRSDTIKSFRKFNQELQKDSVALFYFRGHAVQLNRKNYILPTDIISNESNKVTKVLTIDAVLNIMQKAHTRMNIVIIDSIDNASLLQTLEIEKRGLAKINVLKNTDLIISSITNSSRRSRNFTQQLENIFSKKGMSNNEGLIEFKQKNKRSYLKLSNQEFYFNLPSKLLTPEDKFWKKTLINSSLATLSLYIKTYPKGKYTKDASAAIKTIEQKNAEIESKRLIALEKERVKALAIALAAKLALEKEQEEIRIEKEKALKIALEKKILAQKAEEKRLLILKEKEKYKLAAYVKPEMVAIQGNEELQKFSIGKYEVSNKEYMAYLKATKNPRRILNYTLRIDEPVVNVNYKDAKDYAKWLSIMSGRKYRLPTQNQWEYAARANSDTNYFWGNRDVSMKKAYWLHDRIDNAHLYSWIKSNSDNEMHNIGGKGKNPWGLFDIYGNAYEWCVNMEAKDGKQVLKGGSYLSDSVAIQSSANVYKEELYKNNDLGFRLVRVNQ